MITPSTCIYMYYVFISYHYKTLSISISHLQADKVHFIHVNAYKYKDSQTPWSTQTAIQVLPNNRSPLHQRMDACYCPASSGCSWRIWRGTRSERSGRGWALGGSPPAPGACYAPLRSCCNKIKVYLKKENRVYKTRNYITTLITYWIHLFTWLGLKD